MSYKIHPYEILVIMKGIVDTNPDRYLHKYLRKSVKRYNRQYDIRGRLRDVDWLFDMYREKFEIRRQFMYEEMKAERYQKVDRIRKSTEQFSDERVKVSVLTQCDQIEQQYKDEDKLRDEISKQRDAWEELGGNPSEVPQLRNTLTIDLTSGQITFGELKVVKNNS